MGSRRLLFVSVMVTFFAAVGLSSVVHGQQKDLILATTTSTQDSGLLDVLIPMFEKPTGYFVKTIAVGSGQAMAMGREKRMCCWCIPLKQKSSSWKAHTG